MQGDLFSLILAKKVSSNLNLRIDSQHVHILGSVWSPALICTSNRPPAFGLGDINHQSSRDPRI